MEPPSQGIFRYFPLRKAHFFTPPLPFPTSLRNSWACKEDTVLVSFASFETIYPLSILVTQPRCVSRGCLYPRKSVPHQRMPLQCRSNHLYRCQSSICVPWLKVPCERH